MWADTPSGQGIILSTENLIHYHSAMPTGPESCAEVIFKNAHVKRMRPHTEVTPRPDLPRLEWPTDEPYTPVEDA